jgi:hypothetical protein
MTIIVYCSGSILKGPQDTSKLCWSDRERDEVSHGAHPHQVRFLNPEDPVSDLSDTPALFGRDMYQVQCADAVIVDARQRRGIGIGVEMLASRLLETKLVAVAPRNTYYRQDSLTFRGGTVSDYVHPHLAILCDAVVDTFEEAGRWLAARIGDPAGGTSKVHAAIAAYKERLLPTDQPMLDLQPVLGDRWRD